MSTLLHFWYDCLIIGATAGNGVFGILEFACAFLWVFWRKGGDKKMKQREERVRNFAKWVCIVLFVFSTFFLAPYIKFSEQFNLRIKSEGESNYYKNKTEYNQRRIDKLSDTLEINQKIAQLTGQMQGVIYLDDPNTEGLKPILTNAPALAYSDDGTKSTWSWSVKEQKWK